jgi:hypothetical protein
MIHLSKFIEQKITAAAIRDPDDRRDDARRQSFL